MANERFREEGDVADVGRARRLSKRIATIVASAIEFEIKDPPLALVTVTDTKVTGDLHDATVYYTVRGKTLQDEPRLRRRRRCAGTRQGNAADKGRRSHRGAVHAPRCRLFSTKCRIPPPHMEGELLRPRPRRG